MDLALGCYSLFRMLFLHRMFPVNRILFLLFPGTYPGGGKKGEEAPVTKVEGRS